MNCLPLVAGTQWTILFWSTPVSHLYLPPFHQNNKPSITFPSLSSSLITFSLGLELNFFFIWCSLFSIFIPFIQCQVYSSHYKLIEIGLSSTSFVGTMTPSKMLYLSLNKPHSVFLPRSDLHSYTEFLITQYGLFYLNIFPTFKKKKKTWNIH